MKKLILIFILFAFRFCNSEKISKKEFIDSLSLEKLILILSTAITNSENTQEKKQEFREKYIKSDFLENFLKKLKEISDEEFEIIQLNCEKKHSSLSILDCLKIDIANMFNDFYMSLYL